MEPIPTALSDAQTDAWTDAAVTTIARYYDLDFGEITEDVTLYAELADAYAGRGPDGLLELGAGTGRVAAALAPALAASAVAVTAVEVNAAMRAVGAARAAAAGVTVLPGDMRTLALEQRFGLVICALSTFCHLASARDQRAALAVMRAHLAPGGVAVIDLPAFHADDWVPGPRAPLLEWVRPHPQSGRLVTKWATLEAHPALQRQDVTYLYDEARADGGISRSVAQFSLRHVFRYELAALLAAAGFPDLRWYGSYDLDPVEAGERLIVVAAGARTGGEDG